MSEIDGVIVALTLLLVLLGVGAWIVSGDPRWRDPRRGAGGGNGWAPR